MPIADSNEANAQLSIEQMAAVEATTHDHHGKNAKTLTFLTILVTRLRLASCCPK
jgi:hypothetical protein